jgi:hypothetical protein
MLTVLALTVCGFSGLGCTDEELTAPRRAVQEVTANTLVVADTLCTKMQFTITSATAVTTLFPNRTTCSTTGLVLIRGQAATWAQSPNRRLTLFVRLLNKSGQTLQMPVRLYLPSTGITVVAPVGTPASKVVPLTPDSVEAGGGKIWFVGGTGTLAANDSTVQDTIRVNVQSPVTQARFSFRAQAAVFDTAPPPLPSDWIPPADSTFTVAEGSTRQALTYRTLLAVEFTPSASGSAIKSLLTRYSATVVGGILSPFTRGSYVLQVPDPGPTAVAFQALVAQLRAEPSVQAVDRLNYREVIVPRGRYPSDDPFTATRTKWFDPTSRELIAWRAIRAPLAWGCENGRDTPDPVSIAILEITLGSVADLPAVRKVIPGHLDTAGVLQGSSPGAKVSRSHGRAVTGILTSVGGNDAGTAGMVWTSSPVFYAIGSNDSTTRSIASYLRARVQPDLLASSAHILTTSTALGLGSDSAHIMRYRDLVEPWLQQDTRNLFVYPVDENTSRVSVTYVANTFDTLFQGSDRAVARLKLLYPNQILIVAGTRPGSGALYPLSGFWSGGTDIAAPAESVLVLANTADFSSGVRLAGGVSYAAPMVAGLAAQLRAMDSTLTAAQVKDYIVRGAQQLRLDPSTGTYVAPPAVTGAPETIYQLDAYGALQLLSKERPGTPVCGLEVAVPFSAAVGSNQAVIQRNTPNTVKSASGPITGQRFSLAQGGRLLAVDNRTYQLGAGNFWSLVHTESGADRIEFLERDTAYLWNQVGSGVRNDAFVRIGSATAGRSTGAQNVTAGFQGAAQSGLNAGSSGGTASTVSPTGDWVAVSWSYVDDEYLCPLDQEAGEGSYLVPLRPGVGAMHTFFTQVRVAIACNAPPPPSRTDWNTSITWRSDGGEFFAAHNFMTGIDQYELQGYQVGSGVSSLPPSLPVPGALAALFSWAPEGGVLRYIETESGGSGNCYLVSRSTSNPNLQFSRTLLTSNECIGKPVLPLLRRGVRVAPNPAIAFNVAPSPLLRRAGPPVMQVPMRIRAN